MEYNIDNAVKLIIKSQQKGANFVALPENVEFMSKTKDELFDNVFFSESHPALNEFRYIAKKYDS